jgi:branched-chain amino acid transport system permease protein
MDILLQQIINGLVLGSMYALVALGYTMVYGIISSSTLPTVTSSWWGRSLPGRWHHHHSGGRAGHAGLGDAGADHRCGVCLCVAAALNFTIEKLAYRPLRNSPRLAPLITAIGMSLLLADACHDHLETQPQSHTHSCCPRAV